MQFRVTLKGMEKFVGRLADANRYVTAQWGSLARASELGVKLVPLPPGR